MAHFWFGATALGALCGKDGPKTNRDKSVTCAECAELLRKYRTHFPQAHPEKNEGGAR